MSFASDARGELAREACRERCCARSELAAALLCSGGISFKGLGRYALSITATDGAVARRYFSILKQFWGVTAEIRTLHTDALNGQVRYQLQIPQDSSIQLLEETRLMDPEALFGVRMAPRPELVEGDCCKRAFLRSTFLLCGAVSSPEREYHFEMALPNEDLADYVIEIMKYYEMPTKKACRKAKFVVYLKSAEEISAALSLIGAGAAVLKLEEARIRKDFRNRINRQMNCDSSNIDRVMAASSAQIEDIRYLESEVGLEKLPKNLEAMARLRLENPEVSLTALGELLDPPIGKSGVNARLRRISEIARNLRSGEDTGLGN